MDTTPPPTHLLARAIRDATLFGEASMVLRVLTGADLAVTIRTTHPDNRNMGRHCVIIATPFWDEFTSLEAYHDSWAEALIRLAKHIIDHGLATVTIDKDGNTV